MSEIYEQRDVVTSEPPPDTLVSTPVVSTPVVSRPVVSSPVVSEPVIVTEATSPTMVRTTTAVPGEVVRTSFSRRFTPDALVAAAVGVVLLIIGLIAITRGGFDGPMDTPLVQVLGFGHTTTLGLIEIGIGVALLIAGATTSRSAALFFGSVLGIAAFVGAVQTKSFDTSLGLESSFAWLLVIAGALVVLSALVLPRVTTRGSTVRAI